MIHAQQSSIDLNDYNATDKKLHLRSNQLFKMATVEDYSNLSLSSNKFFCLQIKFEM